MRPAFTRLAAALLLGLVSAAAWASSERGLLIENVHVFDGKSAKRGGNVANVLIVGNTIEQISGSAIAAPENIKLTVLDGGGRTLMPGLIDAHWHTILVDPGMQELMQRDIGYITLRAAKIAEATLLRGFTSVRDMGGPAGGLRRAVEEGTVPGPRIFPSGAMISQTGGHGDFRFPHEMPRAPNDLAYSERAGVAVIADGVDEVLRRAREQLALGATQIKLMAGGGVSSIYDPLDASQYTPEEIRAAVSAAENWGTYVTVHAYTSRAVRMAIEAGVRSIEHGQLIDDETAKLMAERGVWWSLQPFLDDENASPQSNPASRAKQLMVSRGTERAYELAKKHGIKVAFGTDILFSQNGGKNQNARLVSLLRWYSAGEVLKMATGDNARLLALSGERYPYAKPVGVIEQGALADVLLVDGDPTADLELLRDPERNLVLIVKNGKTYKNTLP